MITGNRKTRLVGFVAIWSTVMVAPAQAHDLGVARVELREVDAGHYTLIARFPPRALGKFGPPRFPSRFEVTDHGPFVNRTSIARYAFKCSDAPLTADDTIVLPWDRQGALVVACWRGNTKASRFFASSDQGIQVPLAQLQAGSGSFFGSGKRYAALGVEHILLGVDHLLFVLGLLLLVRGAWTLIKTITAFTVAHSITLALATLGFVDVSSRVVDTAIALSIVFLAVEIVHTHNGRAGLTARAPWLVAFAFGLLHGIGFAEALIDLGIPAGEVPAALLFFNVGVEIGQLMFVAVFLMLSWAFRRLQVTWPRWSVPGTAYALGSVAAYWFLGRLTIIL